MNAADELRDWCELIAGTPPRPARIELGPAAEAYLRARAIAAGDLPATWVGSSCLGVPVHVLDDGRDPRSWRAIGAAGEVLDEGTMQ